MEFLHSNPHQCGKRQWIAWCRKLASAVGFLHDVRHNVVIMHLDIKPGNVLLDGQLEPRLADFGSAVMMARRNEEGATAAIAPLHMLTDGLGRGTQAYTPPETLTAPDFAYGTASDIYALGCTFYSALTGREPFEDVRNSSHQMWAIRRGFWESGANPLVQTPMSSPAVGARANTLDRYPKQSVFESRSLPRDMSDTPRETTFAIAPPSGCATDATATTPMALTIDIPLLRFITGEQLHSTREADRHAYDKVVAMIRGCTAPKPELRFTAQQLETVLAELDVYLLPGTGIDCG